MAASSAFIPLTWLPVPAVRGHIDAGDVIVFALVDDTAEDNATGLAARSLLYTGPERRRHARPDSRWLALMLEEVANGMLLMSDKAFVLHANQLARSQVENSMHPLQMIDRRLSARGSRDHADWQEALEGARRGLRRLLVLGEGAQRACVAVVPLTPIDGHRLTLVTLGRRQVGDPVALQCFSRCHGLTAAENRVLESLCHGREPAAIATTLGVGIATVRTQISSLRHKTNAADITALVRMVAGLPPMTSVLRAGITMQ